MMRKSQKQKRISESKDIPVLEFLWKWKVATTSAVFLRFAPIYHWVPFTAYKRLSKLKSMGLIDTKFVESGKFRIWCLTSKGFKVILNRLPTLSEEGFSSECPEHDLYTLAAQYGEWLPKNTADDVLFISEQELRRRHVETFFDWLPPMKVHRPDGFWYFPNSMPNRLVALEVELNRKALADYIGYGRFYNKYSVIESVVWFVQSANLARKIASAASEKVEHYRDIHEFILMRDLIDQGWNAKIFLGNHKGFKMHEFMTKFRRNHPGTIAGPSRNHGSDFKILDSRHRRFESSTYSQSARELDW